MPQSMPSEEQENTSSSDALSTETSKSETPGQTPTDFLDLIPVIHFAWKSEFTTKSDFAREHATAIAAAACLGWLTTFDPHHAAYTNTWRVTPDGLKEIFR